MKLAPHLPQNAGCGAAAHSSFVHEVAPELHLEPLDLRLEKSLATAQTRGLECVLPRRGLGRLLSSGASHRQMRLQDGSSKCRKGLGRDGSGEGGIQGAAVKLRVSCVPRLHFLTAVLREQGCELMGSEAASASVSCLWPGLCPLSRAGPGSGCSVTLWDADINPPLVSLPTSAFRPPPISLSAPPADNGQSPPRRPLLSSPRAMATVKPPPLEPSSDTPSVLSLAFASAVSSSPSLPRPNLTIFWS